MLQPAATSASSSLGLAIGGQAGAGENLDIAEGFAELLANGLAGESPVTPRIPATLAEGAAALRQAGNAGGKPTGKILPASLPEGEQPDTQARDIAGGQSAEQPEPIAGESLAQAALLPDLLPLAPMASAMPVPVEAKASEAAGGATSPALAMSMARLVPGDAHSDNAVHSKAAVPASLQGESPASAIAIGLRITAQAKGGVGADAAAPASQAPAAPAELPAARLISAPPTLAAAAAQTDPARSAVVAASAGPVRRAGAESDIGAPLPAANRVLTASADLAIADTLKPVAAAELQPVMALREAQALTSQTGALASSAGTNAATPAGPHDFATLVDRLVEARDAAMPQTVRAAVQHSDFGRVSLSFRADDARLSVSMASADPGFAPAVQAAAMQASATADNGAGQRQDGQRQEGQRQDGQAQQQAGQQQAGQAASGNAQSQAQTQAQASARGGRDGSDASRRDGGDEGGGRQAGGSRNSGIYA